jgi:hypothetical protein
MWLLSQKVLLDSELDKWSHMCEPTVSEAWI